MTITIWKWYKKKNLDVDYTKNPITVSIDRDTAKECMEVVHQYRYSNDLAKFTSWEIIDVQD